MQKRAPTLANIVVIILFVLSCFGLLMFLWESFGGPLPLKPKGYRVSVSFPRTLALAEQSDVRISGVNVGHVISLHLGKDGRTHVTLEIAGRYAPIRANMHAIMRQKTLLGESYVQLIPKGRGGPFLGDGKQLADSQVEPSVTLDDVLTTFDPKTRRDFQVWLQSVSEGLKGRGEDVNAGFANLEPLVEHANKLVTILASQEGAVSALVRNTGVVFDALASRDHQLEGLIVNGERTFHAAAESSQEFAQAFRELPAFEKNSRKALKELDSLATVANPYFDEFKPAERQLASTFVAAKPFAPQLDKFLTALGPLTSAARTGLPEIKKTLDLTTPILENLRPVLHNLDPLLQYSGEYVPELQAFFANLTAATQGSEKNANTEALGPKEHFLTTMQVLSPESLAVYPSRIGVDRSNPYPHPGAFRSLASGLPVFDSSSCANSAPSVSGPANETISDELINQIIEFKVANKPKEPNEVAAPSCNQQNPFTFNGQTSQFPHVIYGGK
ncbi:MAG TPA: MlaD family protein [Solirubrobacteraceae bacterium]|nr:MlaD family protein [Solirubrobacteraceae bacterium]